MARSRKHDLVAYEAGDPGVVSYPKSVIAFEQHGEISESGDLYISKGLAGYKTLTFVFRGKEPIIVSGDGTVCVAPTSGVIKQSRRK